MAYKKTDKNKKLTAYGHFSIGKKPTEVHKLISVEDFDGNESPSLKTVKRWEKNFQELNPSQSQSITNNFVVWACFIIIVWCTGRSEIRFLQLSNPFQISIY